MKQLILLLLLVCVSSCVSVDQKPKPITREFGDTKNTTLITLTVNGNSCEFVCYSSSKFSNGIAHWPMCKYCKERNQ